MLSRIAPLQHSKYPYRTLVIIVYLYSSLMVPIFRPCFRDRIMKWTKTAFPLSTTVLSSTATGAPAHARSGSGCGLWWLCQQTRVQDLRPHSIKSTLDDVSDLCLMTILSSLTCRFLEPESFEKPRVFSSILNLEHNFGAELWKS